MDRFGQHVTGFDRLRFGATLSALFQPGGIYLYSRKVLVKEFAKFTKGLTDQIRKVVYVQLDPLGAPIRYVADSTLSKEALVQEPAHKQNIRTGPICLLVCRALPESSAEEDSSYTPLPTDR
jgi:hypothetical protein